MRQSTNRTANTRSHSRDISTVLLNPRYRLHLDPESLNALTHGAGIALSLVGAAYLVFAAWGTSLAWSCGLYSLSLVAVYVCSTLSHAIRAPEHRERLRALDQAAIYLLIAGAYTPMAWFYLPLPVACALLVAIWSAAAVGFWSKVVAKHRIEAFSAWSYMLLGWLPAVAFVGHFPLALFFWIAIAGVVYTVGTVFLTLSQKMPYLHAIWHLFVIVASGAHYYAILLVVQGDPSTIQ